MNVNHVPMNGSAMPLILVDSSNSVCVKGEEKGPTPHSFLIHATSLTPHMIIPQTIILIAPLPSCFCKFTLHEYVDTQFVSMHVKIPRLCLNSSI